MVLYLYSWGLGVGPGGGSTGKEWHVFVCWSRLSETVDLPYLSFTLRYSLRNRLPQIESRSRVDKLYMNVEVVGNPYKLYCNHSTTSIEIDCPNCKSSLICIQYMGIRGYQSSFDQHKPGKEGWCFRLIQQLDDPRCFSISE